MKNRSLVSINDYTKEEWIKILDLAEKFEKNSVQPMMEGKVIASLFFEPSTRTRLSFESAINKLSGRVIGFTDASSSSTKKGESLKDTIKTVANYSDLIIMRHPIEGSARYASEVSNVPIINAGDGANQHPTQTLLDLYSIRKTQGSLDNLNIFLVGDLKHGRTVHSLIMALADFNPIFNFVSPKQLMIPDEYKIFLKEHGIKFYEHREFTNIISEADIVYMTRVQRERFQDPIEYEQTKNSYLLKKSMLKNVKDNLKIMHPLPRVNEINEDIDNTKEAYYFTQALNGVYVRQAIMTLMLGIEK